MPPKIIRQQFRSGAMQGNFKVLKKENQSLREELARGEVPGPRNWSDIKFVKLEEFKKNKKNKPRPKLQNIAMLNNNEDKKTKKIIKKEQNTKKDIKKSNTNILKNS